MWLLWILIVIWMNRVEVEILLKNANIAFSIIDSDEINFNDQFCLTFALSTISL